jgi:hypothetical protein
MRKRLKLRKGAVMRLIDPEMQEILRDMVRPAIEAARLSREAVAAKAPLTAKNLKKDTSIHRTRCDEHREISFTLSTGQVISACAATDCWWSADPSAHEDERYRKTHSDGQKSHADIPFVEEIDGQMVEVSQDNSSPDDPVELSAGPKPVEPLEDVIDKPELGGEITEGVVSDEVEVEVEEELEAA